jgi:hypothetical protein
MGLFGWLANRWTPAYEYRDYYGNEMEYIAWESTAVGSRRGFLLGLPAGVLLTVAVIGGAVMTGLYTPPAPTVAVRERQPEATASQATKDELRTLREENQALKKQLMEVKAAATCPPCGRQVLANAQPPAQAVAVSPHPSKQAMPRAAARRKASVTVPDGQVAPPVPSNCRQEGNCQ